MDLIKWDVLRGEIDNAKDFQILMNLSDKLEAFRIYAKQSKQSLDVQNSIAEYRLRIERKKGEWLQQNIQRGQGATLMSTDSTLKDIGVSRDESSNAQRIAKLDKQEFEQYIQETKNTNKEITLAGVIKIAKEILREEKIETQKEQIIKNNIEQPKGLFDVIVIDPPWKYDQGQTYDPESHRISSPYPELSQEELLKIVLPAKKDCVLWLWTTNNFMKDAYELLNEWGFVPKTILTWDKINMGVGYWLRNVTEHCILAIKGNPVWSNKTYTTLISEKRTEHSVKPEKFYEMVNKICVGNKLDYFARKKREGWFVFGDEVKE
ncbi:MAG: MT-A70 family methyltransferase [Nanoarchaeota archaeon]